MVYSDGVETGGMALIFFSLGKGKAGDTHIHFGRILRSQPGGEEGEGHHLSQTPTPTKAVLVPWETENNSCRHTHQVWEAEPREEGVGLDSGQAPVSLQGIWTSSRRGEWINTASLGDQLTSGYRSHRGVPTIRKKSLPTQLGS